MIVDDPNDPQRTDDAVAAGEPVFFEPAPEDVGVAYLTVDEWRAAGNALDRIIAEYLADVDPTAVRANEPLPPWVMTAPAPDVHNWPEGWTLAGYTEDGALFTAKVGTSEPLGPLPRGWVRGAYTPAAAAGLDLGDVASMPAGSISPPPAPPVREVSFGGPAPVVADTRLISGERVTVDLIGNSPALHVDGRSVAWFENWLRNKEMPS